MKNYKSYFLLYTNIPCFLLLSYFLSFTACSKKNYSSLPEYQFKSLIKKPDYGDLNYWAAHPWKKDPGDSVPKPLRAFYHQDSTVDVFFIHPTTLTSSSDPRWNADIDDAALNAKTDYSTILYQASVFNEKCRVFAPRYRQAHIRSFFIPDSVSAKYFDIAYEDIKAAFIYYLAHYNNGRPIIIAAHSQGTKHAGRLLKEFFEGHPLQNKLVCAYIIGLPVPETYFTILQPCKDSLSTGCFVGWRTFKSGYTEPKFIAKETFKSVVINPLSWSSDSAFFSSSYNKGGVLKNFNKIVPRTVSAQIHNNILWTSKPNVFGKILFTKKNYHIGDINLFYMNIRENVAARINAYWKK
jgi:hypothetical protein